MKQPLEADVSCPQFVDKEPEGKRVCELSAG